MKKQNVFMALALLLFPSGIQASHFLGGEIRYAPDLTNNNTYIIVITHYSNLNSPSDRPELLIDFGDGIFETIPRTGIQDILVAGTCGPVRISTYQTAHTYAGPGNYMIRFEDTNRNGGIVNVPNSLSQSACVSALLVIDPELGVNHSIVFDTLQFMTRRNWNTLVHEPAPFDADGDSLVFDLVSPLGSDCLPIGGYQTPPATNFAWLDPATGTFLWDYPPFLGEFNVTIRGSEYRSGQLIGQVTRDMTICISDLVAGVEDESLVQSLLVQPSITDGPFWVGNNTGISIPLVLMNAVGSVVRFMTLPPGGAQLDVSDLASGTYMVRTNSLSGPARIGRLMKR